MISFGEAEQLVIDQARSFGKETVLLDDAIGRVVAETIIADRDYPPFNRAAMDGYALRQSDWDAGLRSFIIREVIFAGNVHSSTLKEGDCYKIMTGAAVPEWANSIIRKEDVIESGDRIDCLIEILKNYQHIAKRGEDLKNGEVIYSESKICTPAIIGLLASIGKYEVLVERLPRISIITTGDEIVSTDVPVNSVQIRNSNSHVLKALLRKWNILPVSSIHVSDQVHEIDSALHKIKGDIVIICGGVSAGDADHVPLVLASLGAKKIFHKVAMKPGKPIWFGKFDNGPFVFALPGNPFSCMVTFKLFIETFLSHSFGLGNLSPIFLPLIGTRSKKSILDEFFPVRIQGSPSNFSMIPFNGSGDITAAMLADAIAWHPAMLPEISNNSILQGYLLQ